MVTVDIPSVEIYPLSFVFIPSLINNIVFNEEDGFVTLTTTGHDPRINTSKLLRPLFESVKCLLTFEYKSNRAVTDAQIFYCVAGGAQVGISTQTNVAIPYAVDWRRFEFNLGTAIADFGFGMNNSGGDEPKDHFFRFDPVWDDGNDPYIISIRAMQIEVAYSGNPDIPQVE
jgi:hypothetical protein